MVRHARRQRTRTAGSATGPTASSSLPRLVMRPESSILAFDGGHADDLVIQHHRQLVADIGFRERPKRLPPSGDSVKPVSHLPEFVLAGAGIAHLAAR